MDFLHKINYMKYARAWITISIVLTIASLIAYFTMGFNKGIDFTGGNLLSVQFEQKVTDQQVNDFVIKEVGENTKVQQAEVKDAVQNPNASAYLITTPELDAEKRAGFLKNLETLGKFTVISEDQVSGTVSGELAQQAIMAVVAAAVLQIIYLWIRFELKFGVTAVIALLHDVLITVGVVALFRIPINSAFVAAILTILGYSINDTVIVFDRIRENLHDRKKSESLVDLTTRSIQEVITRSIYTVFTVQFALVALLIFGGSSLWDFAMTLFIGITSGMYSSIFIAAAMWLYWQKADETRKKSVPGQAVKAVKAHPVKS